MCGLAGVVGVREPADWRERLRRALDALGHRGPDGIGTSETPGLLLGHRRLAIIAPGPEGHQPMVSSDRHYAVAWNGEVYNHAALREELARTGPPFATATDTEVLLRAYMAWGEGALARLEGMYAIAFADLRQRQVVLARDPFGIKPLYWTLIDGALLFASEPRALLTLSGRQARVNPERLHHCLLTGATDDSEKTLFDGVRLLPAGHVLRIAIDRPAAQSEPCGSLPEPRASTEALSDHAERLRETLFESIRLHLRSDVALGFALSGGLDSSAILAGARAAVGPGAELRAFHYAPDIQGVRSEAGFAQAAARAAGASLEMVHLGAEEVRAGFAATVESQGEPFASPTILAQRQIYEAARAAGIRVMLDGQGADEVFAGYDGYLPWVLRDLARSRRWGPVWQFLRHLPPHRRGPTWRALAGMALGGPAVRAWRAVRGGIPGLPAQGWFSDRAGTPGPGQRPSGGRPLRRRLIETLLGRPLQQVLRFTDRNAMATSIENRVPFLHRGVIELAWSFPADHLVGPEGVHKLVLREAVRHHVPAEIIERRDQMGFITPTVVWLRALAPWARTLLDPLRAEPWIRRDVLDLSWRHATEEGKPEAAQRIWLLLSLAQWRETYDVEFT